MVGPGKEGAEKDVRKKLHKRKERNNESALPAVKRKKPGKTIGDPCCNERRHAQNSQARRKKHKISQ
jgi:hypothetical protein